MTTTVRTGDIAFYRDSAPVFLALFLLTIPAFWPTYLHPRQFERDWHIHLHGLALFAWSLLLIVQPWLIRSGRPALHRTLGKATYVLAPVIVVSTLLFMHYRQQGSPSFEKIYFFYVQFALIALFAAAWAQGIRWRRSPGIHARYMVCTALAMFDPIVARLLYYAFRVPPPDLQVMTYGMIDAILFWLWMRDRRLGNGIRVFPGMLLAFLVAEAPTFFLPQTAAWRAFAQWYAGLPLP